MIDLDIGEKVCIVEGLTVTSNLSNPKKIVIGNGVNIDTYVIMITLSHPNYSVLREEKGMVESGEIFIGDAVRIGTGAIIMPNVHIGRGGGGSAQS